MKQDFHRSVPRDPAKNLEFRRAIHQLCKDPAKRAAIKFAAQNDFFFWLNTFGWVYEPRGPYNLPFCSWPFQEEACTEIFCGLGLDDIGIEKARDMGVTWFVLAAIDFLFQNLPDVAIGLMSRNEDLATSLHSPKSLFWKICYMLNNQPHWLRPRFACMSQDGLIKNLENGSTITGSSTTKDSARGDRYLCFFMDEAASFDISAGYDAWASTQFVTNTRIAVSTPQGNVGIFADLMRSGRNLGRIRRISMHWTKHPIKRRGLYTSELGKIRLIDQDFAHDPDYRFIADGKTRSPWYDKECQRNPSLKHIAQELDIDYGGSGSPFFDYEAIAQHAERYARPPVARFRVEWDSFDHSLVLIPDPRGHLLTWFPDMGGRPPIAEYGLGIDVATGKGGDGTNSVISIANLITGEKVAEFADNSIYPENLAHAAIALRKHFAGPTGDAWLIWESNGPGQIFGQNVIKYSPHKVYMRRVEGRMHKKRTTTPGWVSTRTDKLTLLSSYQVALRSNMFQNHHAAALEECKHYVYDQRGSVIHDRSQVSEDPTAAGENHGDRVIADALVAKLVSDSPKPKENVEDSLDRIVTMDAGTYAGRYARFMKKFEVTERW